MILIIKKIKKTGEVVLNKFKIKKKLYFLFLQLLNATLTVHTGMRIADKTRVQRVDARVNDGT